MRAKRGGGGVVGGRGPPPATPAAETAGRPSSRLSASQSVKELDCDRNRGRREEEEFHGDRGGDGDGGEAEAAEGEGGAPGVPVTAVVAPIPMMPGRVSPPPRRPGAKWPGFLVNRSGLPFDDLTWHELWEFAGHLYPEAKPALKEIQSAPLLQDVPVPTPPGIGLAKQGRVLEYLSRVQQYMKRLSYNHTGTQFFETRPNSSLLTLMEAAKVMIREALPIKCMEAVVLCIYLTNGVPGLGRFTINFKSELPPHQKGTGNDPGVSSSRQEKRYFYHVVLGVTLGTKFGSAGLSRRDSLMDKELHYPSLYSLIEEFDNCYRECGQRLVKVRIGRLVPHDPYSINPIPWKGVTVHPRTEEPKDAKLKVDRFSKELKSFLRTTGNLAGR